MNRWFFLAAMLAAVAPFAERREIRAAAEVALPEPYRRMERLELGERDRRFAEDFPGAVYRLRDGERQYILRRADTATRKLHPAEHCFRGSGYRVTAAPVKQRGERFQSCFTAERAGERLGVCQHVFGEHGGSWSDVSAWYWSALLRRSTGPWWAVTEIHRE